VDVAIHAGKVCILSFPEPLARTALASSSDFEVRAWNADSVAVRALNAASAPATVALVTQSGAVKVNVTLRVARAADPALTLVRFKAASAEEAFAAHVQAEVARRVGPIERRLAAKERELEATALRRADAILVERLLRRFESLPLESHARNDEHVIVHVRRGIVTGNEGYLVFDIENRSRTAFRLASARVLVDGRDVGSEPRLVSSIPNRDASLIGIVSPRSTARGIVAIREVNAILRRPIALELAQPKGAGLIRADRELVFQ
jgi:hypothetical protein